MSVLLNVIALFCRPSQWQFFIAVICRRRLWWWRRRRRWWQ